MKKKLKYSLIAIISIIFLGSLFLVGFRRVQHQLGQLNSDVDNLNNILEEQIYLRPLKDKEPQGNYFVFVGHIYPFNGYQYKLSDQPHYLGNDDGTTMSDFISRMNRLKPQRVIFGGDNVYNASPDQLRYLHDQIVGNLTPISRLVLGNHDFYGSGSNNKGIQSQPELLKSLYDKPFYYEDIERIRLIYLNTNVPGTKKQQGFEKEQLQFLSESLSGNEYDQALVFLHHGLWFADRSSEYVNSGYGDHSEQTKKVSLWKKKILPLLVKGRVKAVFAGDGGVYHQSTMTNLEGIPHYVSGWSRNKYERPTDFLRIEVVADRVNVYRYAMFEDQIYRVPIKEVIP